MSEFYLSCKKGKGFGFRVSFAAKTVRTAKKEIDKSVEVQDLVSKFYLSCKRRTGLGLRVLFAAKTFRTPKKKWANQSMFRGYGVSSSGLGFRLQGLGLRV